MTVWLPLLLVIAVTVIIAATLLPFQNRRRNRRVYSIDMVPDQRPQTGMRMVISGMLGYPATRLPVTQSASAIESIDLDFVAHINGLVQDILASKEHMRGSTIQLSKDPAHGVSIYINGQHYTNIGDIPEGSEKEILRSATAAWESHIDSVLESVPGDGSAPAQLPSITPVPSPAAPEATSPSLSAPATELLPETKQADIVPLQPAAANGSAQPAAEPSLSLSSFDNIHPNIDAYIANPAQNGSSGHPCSVCGRDIPDSSRFCPYCGNHPLTSQSLCPQCNQPIEVGWAYCNSCGAKL